VAITTVERVAVFCKADASGAQLDLLQDRLDAAEGYVRAALRYDPVRGSTTERLSGDGERRLFLSRVPIATVASLTVGGTAWSVTALGVASGASDKAWIPGHGLWLESIGTNVFTRGQNNIAITYAAGYLAGSLELEQIADATAMLAGLLFLERTRLGVGSTTIGQQNIQQTLRNSKDYEFITRTIDRYRRRRGPLP